MSTVSGSGNRAGWRPARDHRRWTFARGSGRKRVRHLRSESALADGASPARVRV